jgi:hypothetical protein
MRELLRVPQHLSGAGINLRYDDNHRDAAGSAEATVVHSHMGWRLPGGCAALTNTKA